MGHIHTASTGQIGKEDASPSPEEPTKGPKAGQQAGTVHGRPIFIPADLGTDFPFPLLSSSAPFPVSHPGLDTWLQFKVIFVNPHPYRHKFLPRNERISYQIPHLQAFSLSLGLPFRDRSLQQPEQTRPFTVSILRVGATLPCTDTTPTFYKNISILDLQTQPSASQGS